MHKANEQVRSILHGCDNLQAMKIMKDIEDRLQGKYQKSKGLPLSIEGHVHALIEVSLMKWTKSSTLVSHAKFVLISYSCRKPLL